MKKIIFVVSTLNTGGAQKILSNLLMNLGDEYEANIVLNDTENIEYPYKGNLIDLGFKQQDNKVNLLYQAKVFLKRVWKLRQMKATGDYIATVSFLDSANIANIVSGKKKCRTIVSVHCNLAELAVSKVYRFLVNPVVKMLYGKADTVIAVSKGIAYDLVHYLKLSEKNIVTIYNGHNIKEIRKRAKDSLPEEIEEYCKWQPVIATMGRMDYQKGQWHLIRAMKLVKDKFPEVRLLLLGEGELQEYLEQLADECGLKNNVMFCGFLNNPFSVIAKSDIFVLPSMFEGFPNALIEALSCELPCIATDFKSGAREILTPELPVNEQIKNGVLIGNYGMLTPVCDGKYYDGKMPLTKEEKFLADAIIKLLDDKGLQDAYRKKAAEAVKNLESEEMVKKWLEVIDA